jgi:hypothetical protein
MMQSRRLTMSNPTAAFSIVAHEALDHIVTDGETDDGITQEGGHITRQRSRRRLRVSHMS